jgi:hypothetical protein
MKINERPAHHIRRVRRALRKTFSEQNRHRLSDPIGDLAIHLPYRSVISAATACSPGNQFFAQGLASDPHYHYPS